ncbi:MAG: TetR-like C-terminal domain-containing protein, partial [bacterium]|nr:TetR-like C-terminal domain-containing protein [bacterium]
VDQPGAPVERSRRAAEAYIAFALGQPQAYKLMFDLSQPTEKDYPDLNLASARARRTMTDHVEGMIQAGLMAGDAELIGHMFWSVLHGMLMLQITGKMAASVDPVALRRLVFSTLLRGLGVTPP